MERAELLVYEITGYSRFYNCLCTLNMHLKIEIILS